ncbi:hypothetical protein PG996_007116 [Apiospora saccharicola]|uniref:Uncharacterized protein n=1 Tax=Apiospora saccharicola TaxID=335842 RepID=A0ABR1V9W2_9PEZI
MRCSASILALVAATFVFAGPVIKTHQPQQHGNSLSNHPAARRNPGLLGTATGLFGLDGTELLGLDSALKLLDEATDPPATAPPANPEQVQSVVRDAFGTLPPNLSKAAAKLISAGTGVAHLKSFAANMETGENSSNNSNPEIEPSGATTIYPRADPRDAPYSLPEAQLRAALYIPAGFTYGAKPPVIFVPGTGSYGGSVFAPNLRKLLTDVRYADLVWLNVPHAMLGDAQQNAEYIAYAIGYVYAICAAAAGANGNSHNVSLITWSQGGLGSQWALTFWPSTRAKVANLLAVAADFRGTTVADLLCSFVAGVVPGLLCDPATKQQTHDSAFVRALRRHGGGSA